MRNKIAKDLHTPKYKMRVVKSKKLFKRKPKHPKEYYVQEQEN